jgi:antitoxin (DNA-binding transcriptional repressor) of toxin-antitoxin stability system
MRTVTIHEAKTHLSRLIQEVLEGEEIVIAKGKTPLVRLVIHQSTDLQRTPGQPGLISFMADDFDAPLEDFAGYQ